MPNHSGQYADAGRPRETRNSLPHITLLISDATPLGAEVLSRALLRTRNSIVSVAVACRSEELLRSAQAVRPDVVLLSGRLADGETSGFTTLRQLRSIGIDSAVVMLLDEHDRDLVLEAFRSGARGVVFRTESFDVLCKCLHRVHEGKIWAGDAQLIDIVEALSSAVPLKFVDARGCDLLSSRQKQIVSLVSDGLSNREIAQTLHLSENTIKNYILRIFDKVGVSSRAELIIYALSRREKNA